MDGGKEQEGLIDREKQRCVATGSKQNGFGRPFFQDRSRTPEECHTGQEAGINPRGPYENADKVFLRVDINNII